MSHTTSVHITHADSIETTPEIIITEIAAPESANLEWIEIQNIGNTTTNIEGWKLYEDNTNHGLTIFQGTFDLRPQEVALIANRAEELKNKYPLLENTIFDSSWGSLKESGEEIGLKNNESQFIELFTYLPHTENSLQKVNLKINDYSKNNWIEGFHTIGTTNLISENFATEYVAELTEQAATKNVENTSENAATQNIQIASEQAATAEIQNTSSTQITTPTARITIQSGVTQAQEKVTINIDGSNSEDPRNQKLTYYWDFGDGYTYENKNPPSHSFREVGIYFITLRVTNEDGEFNETQLKITVMPKQEIITKKTTQTSTKTIPQSKTTIQKKEKAQNTPEKTLTPSKEIPQTYPTILLNEIFPNPQGNDKGQEWVEVYNPNDFPVNILDYILDDYTDEGSAPMKLPEIEILPQGTYLIFAPKTNINNSNEEIQLRDPKGTLLDKVYFSEGFEGQSYARMQNEWLWTTFPTPNFANEIISENLEIEEKIKKETPYINGDLSSEIYISEILPNPSGEDAKGEWIELYNASIKDINLGNWKIDDKEGGSKPYILPDDTIIEARGYIVIPRTKSKISLDNRADTVRLFNFEEELQDELTYEKAKENISFALIQIVHEESTENIWQWTPQITKNTTNPKLYKVRGEIEEKQKDNILIKAKTLKLPHNNELDNIVLSPGNLVELTYDTSNKIQDYTLIREQQEEVYEKPNMQLEIIKVVMLIIGIGTYLHIKKRN